ncbi:MAG TPA: Rieske 2Fe-2S domain-containing protein [Caulobacteraceae bacterium]|jgi:phenylpropionate dioxygenase-like ring-hydroxylating dioxygenase large terminal subunit|nr:Rieske 2Fe-2S domain-containing protein [Caulobacteraceae bacterium]
MLTQAQNETLTRTGPGTAMGALFRRFWIPVLLSRELPEPDGPPVRVRVLGEELIAFRDSAGRVGLVEPRCPHRGANLFFGRNEEGGIRCVFHGWKFDVQGRCLEIPTLPSDAPTYENLRSRAGIVAYPTREWGECVWAYLGPADEAIPPLPELEFALVDPAQRYVSKKLQECNWAQSAEGAVDTAHFSFLHAPVGEAAKERLSPAYAEQVRWMEADAAPRYTVVEHEAGLILAGARYADAGETYWRIAQYLMPNHSLAPGGMAGQTYHGQTWVPIDDTSCWIFTYSWNPDRPLAEPERAAYAAGAAVHATVDADYVPLRRRANDYLIDREAQKRESFTGITGISEQDAAIQDSQGLIHDRTRELLGPTDLGVSQLRALMLGAARDLAAGTAPASATNPEAYRVRSGTIVTPDALPFDAVMTRRFGHPEGRFDLTDAQAVAAE